jgi:hypothetical protein
MDGIEISLSSLLGLAIYSKSASDLPRLQLINDPPTGLKPEYWRELCQLYTSECYCNDPDCAVGVYKGVSRGYESMVVDGISPEAASAALEHEELRKGANLIRTFSSRSALLGVDPLMGLDDILDLIGPSGVHRQESPFGDPNQPLGGESAGAIYGTHDRLRRSRL